jgi:hypothetical protein
MEEIFAKAERDDGNIVSKLREVNMLLKELCRSTWDWPFERIITYNRPEFPIE